MFYAEWKENKIATNLMDTMLRICFYSVELNYLDVFFCIFFKIVLLLSTSLLLDFRLAICSLHEIYQVSEAFQVHGKNTHGMSHMHSICRYIWYTIAVMIHLNVFCAIVAKSWVEWLHCGLKRTKNSQFRKSHFTIHISVQQ